MELLDLNENPDWEAEVDCPNCGARIKIEPEDICYRYAMMKLDAQGYPSTVGGYFWFRCVVCDVEIPTEKYNNGRLEYRLFTLPKNIEWATMERQRKIEERAAKKSKRKVSKVLLAIAAILFLAGLLTPAHDLAAIATVPMLFAFIVRSGR